MTENSPAPIEPRKSHIVLALDIGTTMGWAIARDGVIEASSVKSFFIANAHPGAKFSKFNNWLVKFRNVDEIFYEDVPRFMSRDAGRVHNGFLAFLQAFADGNRIRLTKLLNSSVKKEFTGSGRATKERMCECAHNLGWAGGKKGTDVCHDEADAIAVYYAIMKRRGYEVTFARE